MKSASKGFTLIEVLLATVLLAAGLALAFTTLRSATAVTTRGEAIADRNESMRAVQGFLRQRLSAALSLAYAQNPDDGHPLRFSGDQAQVRFVADLPNYLGRGGPHLHHIVFEPEKGLTAAFALVQSGQTIDEVPPRPAEVLMPELRQVSFRYRGTDESGQLGPWQDAWTTSERLPLQVSVRITDARGEWPELVVALPQGSAQALVGNAGAVPP